MSAASAKKSRARFPLTGFIGLGLMGGPIAQRLVMQGVPLLVHDIDPRAVRRLVACGAKSAASAKAVASQAEIVLTCLPSPAAICEVALGANGLHEGGRIKIQVDLSTSSSDFARDLGKDLQQAGITLLDSPITTGGISTAALEGRLTVMTAGPRAAFDRVEPMLRELSHNLVYIGPRPGQSQFTKLFNNVLSTAGHAATSEAFVLATKAGIHPQTLIDLINAGDASSSAARNRFPQCILPRRYNFGARMAISIKDLTHCMEEADALGVPMWVGQAARQVWVYAGSQGGIERDSTTLINHLEALAGTRVGLRYAGQQPRLPAASSDRDRTDFIVFCPKPLRPALARRLRGEQCTVLGIPAGAGPEVFDAALKSVPRRNRVFVNLCVMASTQSAALHHAAAKRGAAWIDAPLIGTLDALHNGSAMTALSGPAPAIAQVRPLLEALASKLFYAGPRPGAAQIMYQINESLFCTVFAVTCEAFAAGMKAGLPARTLVQIMSTGSGRNAASENILPGQVLTRRFQYGKSIADACHALTLCNEEARRLGVTLWIAGRTRQVYELAAQLGSPRDDITRLALLYEKWAKVKIKG